MLKCMQVRLNRRKYFKRRSHSDIKSFNARAKGYITEFRAGNTGTLSL